MYIMSIIIMENVAHSGSVKRNVLGDEGNEGGRSNYRGFQ
jgi:hypothetical protein